MDTLSGITSPKTGQTVHFVEQGLTPSTTYYLYEDGTPNDTSVGAGTATADAAGDWLVSISSALAHSGTYWLHSVNTGSHASRVGTSIAVAWSAGGVIPVYLTAGTLSATPGNAEVSLSWTPATPLNGETRIAFSSYTLARSTTGPSSGFSNIYTGTTPSFLDTGRTNGTTYWYRVTATHHAPQSTSASAFTVIYTVVSAVPAVSTSVEVWGSIPQ